jgi:hypothetical protein
MIIDERLPSHVVIHECLEMLLQEIRGDRHRGPRASLSVKTTQYESR